MREFDVFRVAGWLDDDGLLKHFEPVERAFKALRKVTAAPLAAACAASVLSVPAHASGIAWPPNAVAQEQALASESPQARIDRLDSAMSRSIGRFMSPDQSDLDPALVNAVADMLKVVKLPVRRT